MDHGPGLPKKNAQPLFSANGSRVNKNVCSKTPTQTSSRCRVPQTLTITKPCLSSRPPTPSFVKFGLKYKLKLSVSEPDLTTAVFKENWISSGFPPGLTVDGLRFYRKKRQPGTRPRSNLKRESGSFKQIKSEYQKKYKNYFVLSSSCGDIPDQKKEMSPVRVGKPEDTLRLEGERRLYSEYLEAYKEYPLQRHDENDDGPDQDERHSRSFVIRPPFQRRRTNLKLEGDLLTTTEKAEKFVEFLLTHRPELARKSTSLKLEGEMDIKTETRDKYVPFEYQKRPPLCKKFTNLHLEGDLDILSENHEKFVPYELTQRPPLTKKETNLHLEGELELLPEYRDVYKEFKIERAKPRIPVNNLKTRGFFDYPQEKFVDHRVHPKIPFLRGSMGEYTSDFAKYEKPKKPEENLKQEGPMEVATENKTQYTEKPVTKTETVRSSNNLSLQGRIDMNPEYRNAYVDYYRSGKASPTQRRKRYHSQSSSLKAEGPMEVTPEYRSSYIDFPRERPSVRKPEGSLSSEGEVYHTTEKRSQYVPYNVPRTEPMKREPELKLEGRFECQPEYRKAYIDYLIRERVERKPRPLDNLGNQKPPQRAFEIITPKTPTKEDNKKSLPAPPITKLTVSPPTITSESSTEDTTKTVASRKPSPKPPKAPLKNSPKSKSISRMESTLFGSKLNVPNKNSRASSPVLQTQRRRSTSRSTSRCTSPNISAQQTPRQSRDASSRFGSPVRVENLACRTTCTSPLPSSLFTNNRRSRWRRDSCDDGKTRAFVVLDNHEINNNRTKYDLIDSSSSDIEYCRKQKWMPSWYNPRLP